MNKLTPLQLLDTYSFFLDSKNEINFTLDLQVQYLEQILQFDYKPKLSKHDQ